MDDDKRSLNITPAQSGGEVSMEVEERTIQITEIPMLLRGKTAVVYGAGGAIGGAVAKAFAREGAKVFLTCRHAKSLQPIAQEISGAGGQSEVAQGDAMPTGSNGMRTASSRRKGIWTSPLPS
jgi:hypothetical protein